MVFGFVRPKHPRVNELLHEAVVMRDARELALAQSVGPAVTRPKAAKKSVCDCEADDRRADRPFAPALTGSSQVDQLAVDLSQRLDRSASDFIEIASGRQAAERVDDHRACHLACIVAAHSIGHGPKAAFRVHEHGILVDLPPKTDVGAADAFEAHSVLDFPSRVLH
jgi:hypothetical protein